MENKILGQTLKKNINSRGAQQKKRALGIHGRKTSILDVPRKVKKILGQTLKKNIDPGGVQKEKKILGQTLKKNIDRRGAQEEKRLWGRHGKKISILEEGKQEII